MHGGTFSGRQKSVSLQCLAKEAASPKLLSPPKHRLETPGTRQRGLRERSRGPKQDPRRFRSTSHLCPRCVPVQGALKASTGYQKRTNRQSENRENAKDICEKSRNHQICDRRTKNTPEVPKKDPKNPPWQLLEGCLASSRPPRAQVKRPE